MSIYKTAALSILTGILGSGKTLRAVQIMKQAVDEDEKVYQCGFKGLQVPGIIDWEDPRKWQELPPGAILFVDEAQKWFGERRHGHAPDYLKAMNTMRGEEGVRMVLLTQHPKYLDPHIKDLVGCHEHLLREDGKESSKLYRTNEVMEDPRSPRGRSKADQETFKFPIKEVGHLYVSANAPHTIKYRMPALVKKAIIIGGLGAVFLLGAWFLLFRNAYSSITESEGSAPAAGETTSSPSRGTAARASSSGSRAGKQEPRWETLTDYAKDHLPRFGAMPWTAPAFDDRRVTADPQLYCLSSMQGEDANGKWQDFTCTCLTEQGTTYEITQGECRALARRGPVYNPYKQQRREDAGRPSESPSAPVAHADPAPTGTVVDYRPGSRGDVFPRSPGYDPGNTYTGPTTGL